MSRAAILLIASLLGSGCATLFRGGQRDLVVYGPENLKIVRNGAEAPLQSNGRVGDRVMYLANVPKNSAGVTLRTADQEVSAPLQSSIGAGWVIADILFWPSLFVDWGTGNWNNFLEVDTSRLRWQARGRTPALPESPAAAHPATVIDRGKLAVLDFRNFAKDLKPEDVRYFTDVVRGATLKSVPNLDVMTRENLLVLLQASGRDVANCEGECEVDTGRRIGADSVISGEVLKVGTRYKISLKLHETHDGRLLSTGMASGKSIDELDEGLQAAATSLLSPQR